MVDLAVEQKYYLDYCRQQKKLSDKTIKAYSTDLQQFFEFVKHVEAPLGRESLSAYIINLHNHFSPSSVRRKIAAIHTFLRFLFMEEHLPIDPFLKIRLAFKAPALLPRIIPRSQLQSLFSYLYKLKESCAPDTEEYRICLRDIAAIELLFASGMRVSELCALQPKDVDLLDGIIRIMGKGSRERAVQIGNDDVQNILCQYRNAFQTEMALAERFFLNRRGQGLSDQSVRNLIAKAERASGCQTHMTPHMFRHSFATMLLDQDVDIRYIQQILGHSTIVTTQIYTHVSTAKQRQILLEKSPRKSLYIDYK